jgi:SAM-dependent methyltransferase/predicted O-methyltransferase YrrM
LRTALRYRRPPARVLEIGSGHGGFVALLRWAGFDARGLELSPAIVDYAERAFGIPMLRGSLNQQILAPGSLDIIAMMDVIEHFPDPLRTGEMCADLLAENGLMIVQTPRFPEDKSFDELVATFDPFLQQLKEQEHIYLFSERSIADFLRRLGFGQIQFQTAIFAHYDMFFVAARQPLERRRTPVLDLDDDLPVEARLVEALLTVDDQRRRLTEQLDERRNQLAAAEADREQRLRLVHATSARAAALQGDCDELRRQIVEIERAFATVEEDRSARLRLIHEQAQKLGTLEGLRNANHMQIEELKRALGEANADRAARLCVIQEQGERLGGLESEHNSLQLEVGQLRAQLDAAERDREARLQVIVSQGSQIERLNAALGRLDRAGKRFEAADPERVGRPFITGLLRRSPKANPGPAAGMRRRKPAIGAPPSAPQLAKWLADHYAFAPELFTLWESYGFHVTPVHFYAPIPHVGDLGEELWANDSFLPGIDLKEDRQLAFLEELSAKFKVEYDAFPSQPTGDPHCYHFKQPMFRSVDAEVLYSIVRQRQPKRIIEVGSGYSTLVTIAALRKNAELGTPGELIAIEPYPLEEVLSGLPGLSELRRTTVQSVELDLFTSLTENDILFIDSSHVLRLDSDVRYLFLEVLPRLAPGVVVHVHDIFLPRDYPREWVVDEHRFWTEQYLLQAFLAFNAGFEVLWAGSYMCINHSDALQRAFRSFDPATVWPGSFWMRRVGKIAQ